MHEILTALTYHLFSIVKVSSFCFVSECKIVFKDNKNWGVLPRKKLPNVIDSSTCCGHYTILLLVKIAAHFGVICIR